MEDKKYLTTNEAVDALKSGKKLKGYYNTDYCYYDTAYPMPFRYVTKDGENDWMNRIWEDNKDKWEIFEEPVYEWQWLYYYGDRYHTTEFITEEEFEKSNKSLFINAKKIEQSKRVRS